MIFKVQNKEYAMSRAEQSVVPVCSSFNIFLTDTSLDIEEMMADIAPYIGDGFQIINGSNTQTFEGYHVGYIDKTFDRDGQESIVCYLQKEFIIGA